MFKKHSGSTFAVMLVTVIVATGCFGSQKKETIVSSATKTQTVSPEQNAGQGQPTESLENLRIPQGVNSSESSIQNNASTDQPKQYTSADEKLCDTLITADDFQKAVSIAVHTPETSLTTITHDDKECTLEFLNATSSATQSLEGPGVYKVGIIFYGDALRAQKEYDIAWARLENDDLGVGQNSMYAVLTKPFYGTATILFNKTTVVELTLQGTGSDTPATMREKLYRLGNLIVSRLPGTIDQKPYPFLFGEQAAAYPTDWCSNLLTVAEAESITGHKIARRDLAERGRTVERDLGNGDSASTPYLTALDIFFNPHLTDDGVNCMLSWKYNSYDLETSAGIWIDVYEPSRLLKGFGVTPQSMYENYKYDMATLPSLGIGQYSIYHQDSASTGTGRALLNNTGVVMVSMKKSSSTDTDASLQQRVKNLLQIIADRVPHDYSTALTATATRVKDLETAQAQTLPKP